ncbi:mannose-1-phosphate guanylyltransferase [Shouchella clausii]|uniref:sugar phosphate nucleotidyltransferase n=1 Tax=Shouchella tritolerans TaxID=2979466 RepID=UPI001B06EAF3|nr:sugar phosphate nucleotidyltransferase [Shouchella tritolerans]GIN12683.1 mannose-1-phosphate guanylyltransferase [Shouchella clausii]
MKLVLLSGGSGKRLWPLSNDSRSKQFLRVLNSNNEKKSSMVERVWAQLNNVGLSESTIIATSYSQVDMITNQLGQNVPLIVEPERRDTFPAIALAATYLYSVQAVSLEEVVAVLPVDPYVENAFFEKVSELETLLEKSDAQLGLIGIEPTYPSSKYGYIIPNLSKQNDYVNVSHFQEKPTEEEAKELLSKNALWNAGVFAFKLGTLIDILLEKGLPIQYNELLNRYSELPKISFDYEVVEKLEHIVALPYQGYWKDLGTWNTLTDEMATNLLGKGMISPDSENTHIVNELDIPVAALGVRDLVIAASPDGILVTEKSASPRIKELLKGFDQRPMFEERRWGWYHVIDHASYEDGQEMLTKRISVLPGKNLSYQYHETRSEVWTVIKGEGEFVLDDKIIPIKAGDVLRVPARAKHGVKALTALEFIEVQTGRNLVEDDKIRLFESWEEIEAHCEFVKLQVK